MEVLDLVIYKGRNIYSHKTVMKMIVNVGKYGEIPTKDIKDFNDKLLRSFPKLKTNCCGLGYEGGFLDRLNEGTYIAHVLEHVILDMQNTLGYNVKYGKTRVIEEPSIFYLVFEYENEICALECSKAAVFILNSFIEGQDFILDGFFDYLKKVSTDAELGPSTSAIVGEAKRRNIPVTRIGNRSLVQLGYGKNSRLIESTLTEATSCIASDIASDKQLTKCILHEHQIPVPYGKVVYSELSAVMAANEINQPVVVKPFDCNQGKGVHLNLTSPYEIKAAFKEASNYSKAVIVEQFIKGKDFRILVVGDKVSAVSQRMAACVTGDGINNIMQLIEIVNQDINRGDYHEKPLTKIRLDAVSLGVLNKKGLKGDYIPQIGEEVYLRENGNISTGGTAIDCTDIIHPDNAALAIRAARAIGIDIAGIDMVTDDISKSIITNGGVIVEVNSAPGIRMHMYPSKGQPRYVAKDIVDLLFPNDDASKFPIVSVTGTKGKTFTTHLISRVLSADGKIVGMTSSNGTFVNNKCTCNNDSTGASNAKALLSNKQINAAVLETACEGIISDGLGYDLADVGIITNISEDHIGKNGLETTKDIAFVKALVIEAIKKNGYAVLNADDPLTDYLLERIKVSIILFSKNKSTFLNYAQKSFIKVYCEDGYIKINDNSKIYEVIKISDISIAYDDQANLYIENYLAAISGLFALKVPIDIISAGLSS